jgi:voltage-gated potassium channel
VAAPSPDPAPGRLDALDTGLRRWLIARSVVVSVSLVALMVIVYYLLPWEGGSRRSIAVRVLAGLVLLVVATVVSVQYVLRSDYPLLRAFEALGFVVGLAVVSFASVYVVISSRDVTAFSEPLGKTDGLYFSLTTATTIGYGDISPRTEGARIVVMIHMVANVVVLGVAARVIVNAARRRADVR